MLDDGWWQEISGSGDSALQVRRENRGKRGGGGWLGLHVEESRLRIRAVFWAEWARK